MKLPFVSEHFVFPFLQVQCRTYMIGPLMKNMGEDLNIIITVRMLSKTWISLGNSITLDAENSQEDIQG